jgi:hypothetical protein
MRWRRLSAASVLFLALISATARADSPPLTAEQVACEEQLLERLQARFADGFYLNSSLLLWRGSAGGGRFEGLHVPLGIGFTPEFVRDEQQLAFEAFFKTEGNLLNPARLPLAETTLARRDVESTVRPAGTPAPPYDVSFEAALGPVNPFFPRVPVQISADAAQRSATGVGRGPAEDELVGSCFPVVSASDARVLRVLARTLRPTCWATNGSCNSFALRYKVTLLREEQPWSFRANVYTYALSCDDDPPPSEETCRYVELERVALEFHFEVSGGKLTTGTVRVLPDCIEGQAIGCTRPFQSTSKGFFILPPLWAGNGAQGPEALARGARLVFRTAFDPDNILSANLDWAELLRDTAWNEGFE